MKTVDDLIIGALVLVIVYAVLYSVIPEREDKPCSEDKACTRQLNESIQAYYRRTYDEAPR